MLDTRARSAAAPPAPSAGRVAGSSLLSAQPLPLLNQALRLSLVRPETIALRRIEPGESVWLPHAAFALEVQQPRHKH
jgi:hypothetical protein